MRLATAWRLVVVVLALVTGIAHLYDAILFGRIAAFQAYFGLAGILFLIGAIFVSLKGSGALHKVGTIGLLLLAVIDDGLLIYTKLAPAPVVNRVFGWSYTWIPLGSAQTFAVQALLILICVILLLRK